ncbi:MAG: hypothetical protein IPK73_25405 [Candidatus Obscuribacter sp.]|nr:hypothetical protein [Candidatus Obscuribacter sp.]MBK9277458.1 hypothetical protein [Candidatus Obscuribacter sp.]
MQTSKRALGILLVALSAAACGLAVFTSARQQSVSTDKDRLEKKLEKTFFFSESFRPDFTTSMDIAEAKLIDELFDYLYDGKSKRVVEEAKTYLQEGNRSWNFYFALGALLIDCKSYTLAQEAFSLSDRKLTETIPDAYVAENYLKQDINLDPRAALTEAYLHELQELERDKKAPPQARAALYAKALKYSHPHGYVYKMYSDFLREQGKKDEAEQALKRWDLSPAFKERRSLDLSALKNPCALVQTHQQ